MLRLSSPVFEEPSMSHRGLWQEGGTTFPDRRSRAMAVCVAAAWVLLIAARNTQPVDAAPFECGSDPWDFLPVGETVASRDLVVIVEAHCANAKYLPGGWIELRYGGAPVDVKLRQQVIGGTSYFQIASIGGVAAP